MKYALFLSVFIVSFSWAKPGINFHEAIHQDLKKEIEKDEDKYKKTPVRGPASVAPMEDIRIQEPSKLDKNIRQIGPNKW